MFIAAQAGVGLVDWKGQPNPLVEAVKEISVDGPPAKTAQEQELDDMRGPKVADSWEEDPRNPRNRKPELDPDELVKYGPADDDVAPRWAVHGDDVADSNQAGSYEALMRGWGGEGGGKPAFEVPRP